MRTETIRKLNQLSDENLEISSVRERVFRGYCRVPGDYEDILEIFNEKKEEIYTLYRSCEMLDERQLKSTLSYYDQFYDIINDPRKVREHFYLSCPLNHRHLYEK